MVFWSVIWIPSLFQHFVLSSRHVIIWHLLSLLPFSLRHFASLSRSGGLMLLLDSTFEHAKHVSIRIVGRGDHVLHVSSVRALHLMELGEG